MKKLKQILLCSIMMLFLMSFSITAQNLLSNPNFEDTSGQPLCSDWFTACGDELSVHCDTILICNAAIDYQHTQPGSNWSLRLRAAFMIGGFVETYLTGFSGNYSFELTFDMLSENWISYAMIGTGSKENFTAYASISDNNTEWEQYSINTDTLSLDVNDTITVRLSAGEGEFCLCTAYFDNLLLTTQQDTTTDIENVSKVFNNRIEFYPNPANSFTTITLPEEIPNAIISLHDLQGREVLSYKLNDHHTLVPLTGTISGVYVISVVYENQVILRDRLVVF